VLLVVTGCVTDTAAGASADGVGVGVGVGEAIYDAASWGGGAAMGVASVLAVAWHLRRRLRGASPAAH
jgi:hypothetical protein